MISWSTATKHPPHFDITSETAAREFGQIGAMLADLDRTIKILNCDIATEEERARVSNPPDAAYPTLARMLAARRENLKTTAAALERRLVRRDPMLSEQV
jgi:hypothetical protein